MTTRTHAFSTASLVAACCASAAGMPPEDPGSGRAAATIVQAVGPHLTPDQAYGELLAHPAFAGFAHLILPRVDVPIDLKAPLHSIASLLPYHEHVDVDEVMLGLNRLIDDASAGRRIFYDVYSEAEKRREPTKAETGLFFLRGRPGAPFALIAPGGGFSYVGSVHEGFPYALQTNRRGYNAFVVRYRVGLGAGAATEDLAAALAFIFANAKALEVSTDGYSLWGSSAGARIVAAIGTHGSARFGAGALPAPSAIVMAYTGHTDYSAQDPPTFAVVGERDRIASPSTMERRIEAMKRAGVMAEYRRFAGLGHGFGSGAGTNAAGWIDEGIDFWERAATRIKSKR